jgi:hypothetical protein
MPDDETSLCEQVDQAIGAAWEIGHHVGYRRGFWDGALLGVAAMAILVVFGRLVLEWVL